MKCKWLKTIWTSPLFATDHPADMETLGQTGEGDLFLYLGFRNFEFSNFKRNKDIHGLQSSIQFTCVWISGLEKWFVGSRVLLLKCTSTALW